MNLHGIVAPYVGAVNQRIPVGIQISIGPGTLNPDGTPAPLYANPGSISASIGGSFEAYTTGTIMTVTAVIGGSLQSGDLVSGTDGGGNTIPSGCAIISQLTGLPGGSGTYLMGTAGSPGDLASSTITSLSATLNVTGSASGVLLVGQTLADLTGALAAKTTITELISGAGGAGTYGLSNFQTVPEETMTTSMTLLGQIQPITWRDLQQLDGLNTNGVRWKIYLSGEVDGIVRKEKKGGDLITIPPGSRHAGTWLVAQVLEQFPDWVCAAIVLQSGS